MKINFEGKQFEVFMEEEEVIDTIFVSLGFHERPEIEALEEDDGKTPMHLLKKDVTISDNVLKENMTLTDLVNFVDMAFMAGINLVEIVRATGKDKKELFEMADHIEFTPAAFMPTVKDFCIKDEDPGIISSIFTYLVANYVVVSTRTGVDKFVCDTAGDKTASVTLKRGDNVVAEVDMVNETVKGTEAEAVSDFFIGPKGNNFVCVKAKEEQKPEPKKDKEIEKACEKILEMADKPEEKKPEKKEVKEEKKPEKKEEPKQETKKEEPKQETKKETKPEVKEEKKEDHSKPSGKLVWNKETKQWETPGSEPVVEQKGETTIINNPTENVVLADTVQAVERVDLRTIYYYTAQKSYDYVPVEDKADVMLRVQAALKSLIVDPKNVKKYLRVGGKVAKYGIVRSNYIDKNNFSLTNGTKTWIFILDKDGNRKFNFLPSYKEALAWSAEEKKEKASA